MSDIEEEERDHLRTSVGVGSGEVENLHGLCVPACACVYSIVCL